MTLVTNGLSVAIILFCSVLDLAAVKRKISHKKHEPSPQKFEPNERVLDQSCYSKDAQEFVRYINRLIVARRAAGK